MSSDVRLVNSDQFYVLTRESGADGVPENVWANRGSAGLESADTCDLEPHRVEIPGIDHAFEIRNVLSEYECRYLIAIAEQLGVSVD